METYSQIIAFLITQNCSHCHDSEGNHPRLMLSLDVIEQVTELSIILGKLEVYSDKDDKENFELIEQQFSNKCDDFDIDMEEFEDWCAYQPEEQEDGE